MSVRIQQIFDRFDALTLRERIIIAFAFVVALLLIWHSLVMEPITNQQKRLASDIKSLRQQVSDVKTQTEIIIRNQEDDPNRENRARLGKLKQQVSVLNKQIRERMHGLIDPFQMAQVLEKVLTQKTNLKLQRVQSLAARPLLENEQDSDTPETNIALLTSDLTNTAEKTGVGIYRHTLQIEFTGTYMSTLAYLRALEKLPWEFYWKEVSLKVEKYPQSRVIISVYTLSLQESWIGV